MKLLEQIIEATVTGDPQACASLAREAVGQGLDPLVAIEQGYSKGMAIVGEKFARMAGLARRYGAGIVLGTRVPVVLTSRADSLRTRLASVAVLVQVADALRIGI